jgi:hypothetical protein
LEVIVTGDRFARWIVGKSKKKALADFARALETGELVSVGGFA